MKRYWGLRGPTLNIITILLVVMPSMFCYGYNLSAPGGVLTLQSFVTTFPKMDTINTSGPIQEQNSRIQGTVIALLTLGGMCGSMSCIWLGDILGRRMVIFLACVISITGSVLMSSSFSLGQFIVSRLLLGMGTGGCAATIPVWQSEISQASHRGAHVVTEGIFIGAGVSVGLWVDFGLFFVGSSVAWKLPLALPILFLLPVMAFIFTLPESPRWLIKKNRYDEARVILGILEGLPADSPEVTSHVNDVLNSLQIGSTGSIRDLFTMGSTRIFHRMILAVVAESFIQISGINLITFYATTIFQTDLGFGPVQSRILASAMATTQPIGGVIAYFTIDRYGRRNLMMFGAAGMAICMTMLAATTSNPSNHHALIAAVVFLFLINLVYTVGFLGVPFLYATEVAPLNLRAAITGLATGTMWIFNFLVVEVTPVGFNTIHYRYYIIYAVVNAFIIPIIFFLFPETTGGSLEEIDGVFAQSQSLFDPPRFAKRFL